MKMEFDKAYSFLFDETYRMWKSDLTKIFRIGTRGSKGGCNLSSCILVFIGIESFSKFSRIKRMMQMRSQILLINITRHSTTEK